MEADVQSVVTDAEVKTFCFKWVIKQYSFLKHMRKLVSDRYVTNGKVPTKWELVFYPNGEVAGSRNETSFYLRFVPSNEEEEVVIVTCVFEIKSVSSNDHWCTAYYDRPKGLNYESPEYGYCMFISNKELEARSSDLLPDDTLTLVCRGEMVSIIPAASAHLAIKIPENSLSDNFRHLMISQVGSDVVMVSKENREVPVHKCVLLARSPVFTAMFKHNTLERTTGKIYVEDMEESALTGLVYYMYTDEAPENLQEIAMELLAAAEKYDLPRLKSICEHSLASTLQVDRVIPVLNFAIHHNASELRNACLVFAHTRMPEL